MSGGFNVVGAGFGTAFALSHVAGRNYDDAAGCTLIAGGLLANLASGPSAKMIGGIGIAAALGGFALLLAD